LEYRTGTSVADFRNTGDSHANGMAIIVSKEATCDGGRMVCAPQILQASKETRMTVDSTGDLKEV